MSIKFFSTMPLIMIAFGCYPTLNEQDASAVSGEVLMNGEPVVGAKIAIGAGFDEQCIDWSKLYAEANNSNIASMTREIGKQPHRLSGKIQLAQPVAAITDKNGKFEVPGRSSPGLVSLNREKIWSINICIIIDEKQLYRDSVSYLVGHDRCERIKVSCDIANPDVCEGGPQMIGVYGHC